MIGRSLPALALALAALAAVLLPIAIARRCGGVESPSEPPPSGSGAAPVPPLTDPAPAPAPDDVLYAAVFGAACRHAVSCGTGELSRCAFVEDTMRRMPRALGLKSCELDQAEARSCIAALAGRDCAGAARSLDVLALRAALERIDPCRRACAPTASSP
jgi:hypothetical protein